jgi:hypothetical protein
VCLLLAKLCWHCLGTLKGPILKHYQDHGQMVNSSKYCAVLEEELEHTVCSKHRGMLTKWSCVALWQHSTTYGSGNHQNDSKTEIWASPPPSLLVYILPHSITIFSDCSGMCCMDSDLQVMKRARKGVYMALHATIIILYRWYQEACGRKLQMCGEGKGLCQKITVYLFLL